MKLQEAVGTRRSETVGAESVQACPMEADAATGTNRREERVVVGTRQHVWWVQNKELQMAVSLEQHLEHLQILEDHWCFWNDFASHCFWHFCSSLSTYFLIFPSCWRTHREASFETPKDQYEDRKSHHRTYAREAFSWLQERRGKALCVFVITSTILWHEGGTYLKICITSSMSVIEESTSFQSSDRFLSV